MRLKLYLPSQYAERCWQSHDTDTPSAVGLLWCLRGRRAHDTEGGQLPFTIKAIFAHILGDPAAATLPVLWGVPVFKSASVASGKFLAADLQSSAALFVRQSLIADGVAGVSEDTGALQLRRAANNHPSVVSVRLNGERIVLPEHNLSSASSVRVKDVCTSSPNGYIDRSAIEKSQHMLAIGCAYCRERDDSTTA